MIDVALSNRIIDYMNGLLEADRVAVGALVGNRVPCNETLANHPTCQVQGQNGGNYVGLLGILNGLCGINEVGWGAIAAVFDEDPTNPQKFPRLKRFQFLTAKQPKVDP